MKKSYIIQLTTSPEDSAYWIHKNNFWEGDNIGRHANYFIDISGDERKEVLEQFTKLYASKRGTTTTQNGEKVWYIVLDTYKYKKQQYKAFRSALKRASEIKEDQFMENPGVLYSAYESIENACNDPFGYYITDDYGATDTLASFMANLPPNTPLYIGGVVGYGYV